MLEDDQLGTFTATLLPDLSDELNLAQEIDMPATMEFSRDPDMLDTPMCYLVYSGQVPVEGEAGRCRVHVDVFIQLQDPPGTY